MRRLPLTLTFLAGVAIYMEAVVRVLLPTTGTIPVTIEWGDLGETTVRLFCFDSVVAAPLGEFSWAGVQEENPKNCEVFSLNVLPEGESTPELPYSREPLEGMVEKWRQVIFEFSSDVNWQALYRGEAQYETLIPAEDSATSEPAAAYIQEHLDGGRDSDLDYSLFSLAPALHIPCDQPT